MKSKSNLNVRSALFAVLIAAVMLVSASSVILADTSYNDSWDEAEYIYDGDYVSGTLDEYSDYQDFYQIDLDYGETIDIDMTGYGDDFDIELSTLDYDTYYYDYYLTDVASSTSFSSSESISYYVYSTETYYIKVYAPSGSGTYYLDIEVSTYTTDDYNNDYSEAEYTYDGAYEYATLDSSTDYQDFYYIYIDSGYVIDIDMTGTGTDFDLKLHTLEYDYYDYYLSSVAYSTSGSSTESISYQATSSENYYIEVYATSGSGTYDLTIDVYQGTIGPEDYYVGGPSYSSGEPLAELPTVAVGSSAYFGGIMDLGEELGAQIDESLEMIEDFGFDVTYDIEGGIGMYMGWEVIDDSTEVNGYECYDMALMGALGIDLALDMSVEGGADLGDYYMGDVSVDGSGSATLTFEATMNGHLYQTVDEMAIAKIEFTIEANGEMQANMDATMEMDGADETITVDMTGSVDGVKLEFSLEFDPPLDIYQYGTGDGAEGIYEGKTWYVPAQDTEAYGEMSAEGTISYDIQGEMTGEEDDEIDDSDTYDLAEELGSETYSETIPGGQSEYYYDGGIMFECVYADDSTFIIETDLSSMYYSSFLGTRQSFVDPTSMIPSAGMQVDAETGMVTGFAMDGEVMTEPCEKSDVESFVEDPLGTVQADTGGSNLMLILVIVIVIVVVILVVVMVVVRKKKAQPPQPVPPQGQYQQPPSPQQYPVQDQYGQYPPQDPYQQGQYQQPPPPPPQY